MDLDQRQLNLLVDPAECRRRIETCAPAEKRLTGRLKRYAATVSGAGTGAVWG